MQTLWVIYKARSVSNKKCPHPDPTRCLCRYDMFFDGHEWQMATHNALKYSTREEAESAAFLLVTQQADEIGKIMVKEIKWSQDDDE